jgi:hypothetical protein
MNQTAHSDRSEECPTATALASSGSTPSRCGSRSGRQVNGPIPFTSCAITAAVDQAAMGGPRVRPGADQVCVTGCRQCGHTLPEGSRRHLNRCQNVRCIRSSGLPKAGRWSGSCTDRRCKYGYHHTIVLHGSRLDAETRLAKGKLPLESLRWSSPSVNRPRSGFVHAFCTRGSSIQPCSNRQPDGCPLIIVILIRIYFRMNRNYLG